MLRTINVKKITETVKNLCIDSNIYLPQDIKKSLLLISKNQKDPLLKNIADSIVKNYKIAEKEKIPVCQDTGIVVVFLEVGQDVKVIGGSIADAVNEGVRRAYKEGYLRFSVVRDPLKRKNTEDNTPAVIHTEIVKGNKIKITVMPKGAGSENMSSLKMFSPSAGIEDIKNFVKETVRKAWSNPCPPVIAGVGIGGTFDSVTLLAKKALLRKIGSKNRDAFYSKIERELLKEINDLNIGIEGFGGKPTALAVFIEKYPCHIASLPVAVNIQCHVARHKTEII